MTTCNNPPGRSVTVYNVLSPCLYWVRNVPITRQDFDSLQWLNSLSEHCHEIHKSHIKSLLNLNKDDYVAVLSKDGKTWDRGQVKSYFQTGSNLFYQIFLIDKGQEVKVEPKNVISLSENFISKPPLAYQIGVYGILPKSKDDDHKCQKLCKCTTTKCVKNLLTNYAIHFDRVVEVNDITFGHVYLDCQDEGFINLADILCKDELAVRAKQFKKEVIIFYSEESKDSDVSNSGHETITSENVYHGRATLNNQFPTGRISGIGSERPLSGYSFSSGDASSSTSAISVHKSRQVQYYPAGMVFQTPNKTKVTSNQRISKMNGVIDQMKKSHYSGRLMDNGRNSKKIIVNSSRKEVHNTKTSLIQKQNTFITKSNQLNDMKIDCKLNESMHIDNNSKSDVDQSFKKNPISNVNHTFCNEIKSNTSLTKFKKPVSYQADMSKFIQKIAKLKDSTELTGVIDNNEQEGTAVNNEAGCIKKTDTVEHDTEARSDVTTHELVTSVNNIEYNGKNDSREHCRGSNQVITKEVLSVVKESKTGCEEMSSGIKESKYGNNFVASNEQALVNIENESTSGSKHNKILKLIDKIISLKPKENDFVCGTQESSNHIISPITESVISCSETDSVDVQDKCFSQPERKSTIENEIKTESPIIEKLKFIDKVKNLTSANSEAGRVNNVHSDEFVVDECLEVKDNKAVEPIDKAKITIQQNDPNTERKEIFTSSQLNERSLNERSTMLDKWKALNFCSVSRTETDSSSIKSFNGNDIGLNFSLSGEYSPRLVPKKKSLNLRDKIKEIPTSLNTSSKSEFFKELENVGKDELHEITIENHNNETDKHAGVANDELVKETINIHGGNTLIKSENLDHTGIIQSIQEISDSKPNSISPNKVVKFKTSKDHVNDEVMQSNDNNESVQERSSSVEENSESQSLSLPERLKLLRRSLNSSDNTINNDVNNCSLDSDKTADYYIDSNNDFKHSMSTSYPSDSHISFNCRKSLDLNVSAMTLNSTRGSDTSFQLQNSSNIQGYFDYVRSGSALLHGKQKYKPVKAFYDVDLDEVIFQNLENSGLRDLSRIQKYAFPVIIGGQNIVMVSPRRSGKSLAYIVPLLCLLRQTDKYQMLPKGNGPLAVIIVSGWKSAQKVFEMCKKLLASICNVHVQVAYEGGDGVTMRTRLTNGCDLLISTPRCFLRLLKEKYVTNINRICHFILDETDKQFETFMPEVQEMVRLVKEMLIVRESSGINIPVQSIVLSHKWTPPLEELVLNILQDPVICIASHLEAAVYSRVKPVAVFLKPENKITKLFELLLSRSKQQKTVVVCALQEEVEQIALAAKMKEVDVILAHQGMPQIHCADLQKMWASKPASHEPILICTDDVLGELAVVDAQNLIHFSLPQSKTCFSFRFGCLLNAYRCIFDPDDQKTCQVHIFVDESNEIQLPEISSYLQRLGIKVPPTLEATVEKILIQRELKKEGVSFCENLKQFGRCWDKQTCSSRHILKKKEDLCQDIPQSGEIKMTILHVHNACHYSVRILEHFNGEVWIKIEQFYIQIATEINNYFNKEETRRLHGFPNIGDIAALETSSNSYQRVQVLKIIKYDERGDPSSVLVRLMDEGYIAECQVMELFTLPEKLKVYPAQAVDVYICRMLPVDLDQTWNNDIKELVISWIKEMSDKHKDSYFVGKIVLSLCRNIWLDPLECKEWLPLCGTSVQYLSMRKRLLDENLAVDNPEHLTALYKLCNEAGISFMKKPEPTIQTGKNSINPQWAHLSQDDYTCVNLVAAVTLDKIFLRIVEFQDRLDILCKDIEADVINKDTMPPGSLEVSDYCLGRFPSDDKWYRAMIVNISDKKLELFFVDHGDFADVSWNDIKKIPPEFITRLPFQMIECYLAGVQPLDGQKWEDEAVDFLFDITEIDGTNKNIFVKVHEIDLKAKLTGGRRYKVVLVDTSGSSDVILNSQLVLKGFATFLIDEKHLLDNVFLSNESEGFEESIDRNIEDWSYNKTGSLKNNNVISPVNYGTDSLNNNFGTARSKRILTEEELERVDESLLDLARDDFEYFGNIGEHKTVEAKNQNKNTVSIREIPVDISTPVKEESTKSSAKCKEKSFSGLPNLPELVNHGKYPNLVWHQNAQYVCIRVMLNDVQKYRLVWQIRELHFSTIHQEVFYAVNLNLYGGMKPEQLEHSAKGFYVEIKFQKAVQGFYWPRLHQEKTKFLFVKTNLEHYEEQDSPCLDEVIEELKMNKSDQLVNHIDDNSSSANSIVNDPDFDRHSDFSSCTT